MKFVDPSSEVLPSECALSPSELSYENAYSLIEKCGKICYKSTCSDTPEGSEDFVKRLIKNRHFAMLEHVNFVFEVTEDLFKVINEHNYFSNERGVDREEFRGEPLVLFSDKATFLHTSKMHLCSNKDRFLVSGNVRALNDSRCLPLLAELSLHYPTLAYSLDDLLTNPYLCMGGITDRCYPMRMVHVADLPLLSETEFMAHSYLTYHVVTDRGVSHEIVRHRLFSFAQESTRYCNYAKDKFGNELTFITPTGWDSLPETVQCLLKNSYKQAEDTYLNLVGRWKCECTPQMARAVLPNGIKTEMCITGNLMEWKHFFDLRYRGLTGEPHPDMKVLSTLMFPAYVEKYTSEGFTPI
jgi:thymidylate synthase (FAD)